MTEPSREGGGELPTRDNAVRWQATPTAFELGVVLACTIDWPVRAEIARSVVSFTHHYEFQYMYVFEVGPL